MGERLGHASPWANGSVVWLLAILSCGSAAAQSPDRTEPVRARFGVLGYGTGDVNCGTGVGLVGGIAARTTGSWFAAVAGDVHFAGPVGCTLVATTVPSSEGGSADRVAGVELIGAPRLSVHVGRRFGPGEHRLESTFGVGALRAGSRDSRSGAHWIPWSGGALTLHRGDDTTFELEAGLQRVPYEYFSYDEGPGWQEVNVPDQPTGSWRGVIQLSFGVAARLF